MFRNVEETSGEGVWVGDIRLLSPHSDSTPASVFSLRQLEGVESSADKKLTLADAILLIENPTSVTRFNIRTSQRCIVAKGKTSVEMTASVREGRSAIALRDFQQIWLTATGLTSAFYEAGIGSKPGGIYTPDDLIRLSDIGGHGVTFSGDGKHICWLLGPVLHNVDVDQPTQASSTASLASPKRELAVSGVG